MPTIIIFKTKNRQDTTHYLINKYKKRMQTLMSYTFITAYESTMYKYKRVKENQRN